MKKILTLFTLCLLLFACDSSNSTEKKITITAAASLENVFTEKIIPLYESKNNNIKITGIYDASGKLQTQIEEGLETDIFLSAANKQMDSLIESKHINKEDSSPLLKNEVVLITNQDSKTQVTAFSDITKAKMIAIGDPESVPAGIYAKEIFENLKIWDEVSKKSSLGTNVTEVLEWVAANNAEVGVVYSSDAMSNDKVKVIDIATPEILKSDVTYPIALLKNSNNKENAQDFINFLKSDEVAKIFEEYGFTPLK